MLFENSCSSSSSSISRICSKVAVSTISPKSTVPAEPVSDCHFMLVGLHITHVRACRCQNEHQLQEDVSHTRSSAVSTRPAILIVLGYFLWVRGVLSLCTMFIRENAEQEGKCSFIVASGTRWNGAVLAGFSGSLLACIVFLRCE